MNSVFKRLFKINWVTILCNKADFLANPLDERLQSYGCMLTYC